MGMDNKYALVTGGSRGIGKAIAKTLAQDGFHILLTYVSRPELAKETVKEIEEANGKAEAFELNVADEQAVVEFFTKHIRKLPSFDVLINNAGIVKDGFLIRAKEADFDAVLAVSLRGAFICSREAAKIMGKQRSGKIVNISSVVGQMGNATQTIYSAAKAGLLGLTKSCAKELAARNINVNAVAPGFIETDMTANLSEDLRAKYTNEIPLGRMGSVQDVANAVSFLASEKASYITGQILAVNGGLYC